MRRAIRKHEIALVCAELEEVALVAKLSPEDVATVASSPKTEPMSSIDSTLVEPRPRRSIKPTSDNSVDDKIPDSEARMRFAPRQYQASTLISCIVVMRLRASLLSSCSFRSLLEAITLASSPNLVSNRSISARSSSSIMSRSSDRRYESLLTIEA